MNRLKRLEESCSHQLSAAGAAWTVGGGQLLVNPGDQIPLTLIPKEQVQGIGGLVQAALPERVSGKGAGGQVLGVSTGAARFSVVAAGKPIKASKLGAGGATLKGGVNVGSADPSMLFHVGPSNGVGDPLVAGDIN
jgi:hypothetical protein